MGLKSSDGCPFKLHTESDIRGDSLTEEKPCEDRGSETGMMWPQVKETKECREPLEAGRVKEEFSSGDFRGSKVVLTS